MPLFKASQASYENTLQTAIDIEAQTRFLADAAINTALDQLTQRVNNLSSSSGPVATSPRDKSRFTPLTYGVLNSSSYSYYNGSYSMELLNDGNVTSGMMAFPSTQGTPEGRIYVHVAMASASFLNAISLWCGQFNGAYNLPTGFEIYQGFVTGTSNPLYTSSLAQNGNQQTFDLTSIPALNTALISITIAIIYANGSGTVSVNEIGFRGYTA